MDGLNLEFLGQLLWDTVSLRCVFEERVQEAPAAFGQYDSGLSGRASQAVL